MADTGCTLIFPTVTIREYADQVKLRRRIKGIVMITTVCTCGNKEKIEDAYELTQMDVINIRVLAQSELARIEMILEEHRKGDPGYEPNAYMKRVMRECRDLLEKLK